MSINIEQFRTRISAEKNFSSAEIISDSVVRALRTSGDSPFAVYYFDVAQNLPDSEEDLTKYQDQILGKQYFEGRKSLQWSNYLYFITSDERLATSKVQASKKIIESDRKYARKFVISEKEIDSVIKPAIPAGQHLAQAANILATWMELLAEEGLDEAILNEGDLPARLQLVEKSKKSVTKDRKLPKAQLRASTQPFLSTFELKKFRPFPIQHKFEFKTVNLLFGSNGAGKTSLLEAIEKFYCGKNKRNPNDSAHYELIAHFSDNTTESADDTRKPKLFRERNLAWYGQSEIKTNDLYRSFAQFNFLDTDAAVSLSDSANQIEEDLSKLLVGPDASKVWHNITRVAEAVASKIRDLRPLESQYRDEITQLTSQLKNSDNTKRESDSILTRLNEMINLLGWRFGHTNKETFASHILENLSELESLLQEATSFVWTDAPVSMSGLLKYSTETKSKIAKTEVILEQLDALLKTERRESQKGNSIQDALNAALEAKNHIKSGIPARVEQLARLNASLAKQLNLIASVDDLNLGEFSQIELNMSLGEYCKNITDSRVLAENQLKEAKGRHAEFAKLRDESYNLSQQLRSVATRILQSKQNPDECPLCHTIFSPGELLDHINRDIEDHSETYGQTLLTQLREREDALQKAVVKESEGKRLLKFRDYESIKFDVSVGDVIIEINKADSEHAEMRESINTLTAELRSLETQGLSNKAWLESVDKLDSLGYALKPSSIESVETLLQTIQTEFDASKKQMYATKFEIQNLLKQAETVLGSPQHDARAIHKSISELKEKLTLTDTIREKLFSFFEKLPWPSKRPIGELIIETASLRNVANELQTALGKEKEAKSNFNEWTKRKDSLSERLKSLQARIKRLNEANKTFDTIQNRYSLEGAMKSAIERNRAGIESIFAKIHSPAEFKGLGDNFETLIRKLDGTQAKLSQISTGQRAAFALSIFLAQNSQIEVAPPVMLIDDPIAHIDDLNSLSFLDYLRELVLAGKRQVFFATANDKLAALFERKFDFLGAEGFRRFDLLREA